MNVYSQLWELLRPTGTEGCPVCFGQISGIRPPAVTLAGQAVSALWPRGTALTNRAGNLQPVKSFILKFRF